MPQNKMLDKVVAVGCSNVRLYRKSYPKFDYTQTFSLAPGWQLYQSNDST